MKRIIKTTADGSKTIFVEELNEHYHSVHGALAESRHVFINAGFLPVGDEKLHILELGFGTGLNVLTTLEANQKAGRNVFYTAVEAYPVKAIELAQLNYAALGLPDEVSALNNKIHQTPWEEWQEITPNFKLLKQQKKFQEIIDKQLYHLIYFDAFAPEKQPELWTVEIFEKMYKALKPGGVLVTYCAKGQVKRNMKAAGFLVQGIPGPPGKREMTRATKPLLNV